MMHDTISYQLIQNAYDRYAVLLQEAEQHRLCRMAIAGNGKASLGARLAATTGKALVTAGIWLQQRALPEQHSELSRVLST
ncbi:MAG: hypothetical protein R3C14_06620 [Caldilineaceae bacterium]